MQITVERYTKDIRQQAERQIRIYGGV